MLTRTEELFFELLRIALGTQEGLTTTLTDDEWLDVSQMAVKQSVLGILYSAVEKLPEAHRPPTDLFIDMYQCVQEIEDRNRHMNKMTALVSSRFRKDGFPNCILKGQGIALLYPNPLRRQSGDIDIWLKGERKEIVRYIRSHLKNVEEASYLHIGFYLKDISIEAHFCPSYAFSPLLNNRLQHWFQIQQEEQISHFEQMPETENMIPVPTVSFNVVFILHHIYRHFFDEGIGLRQVIDFFYVLESFKKQGIKFDLIEYYEKFGLSKFASSIFWIIEKYLGMDMSLLYIHLDEKGGQQILDGILLTGNMGRGDPQKGKNRKERITHRYKRLFRFVKEYPCEILLRHPFFIYQTIKFSILDSEFKN